MTDYSDFIKRKASLDVESGFVPSSLGSHLFDFQSSIVEWACKRGRAAIFADTGLGKTAMQTEWARQVAEHTGGKVLIAAPLCVAQQTVEEASKFGIHIQYCRSPSDIGNAEIIITNYEMLDKFDPADFAGIVLDESSILKSHTSKTRALIIEMFQQTPYRLSCTATPSPNDHMELGNQAEFLGVMTSTEMLAMFFVHDGGDTSQWRLKGHGKTRFWEWMATWSICIRNPADLGFDGSRYNLPGLRMHEHVVESTEPMDGQLFAGIAQTLTERRDAKRASLTERVEKVVLIIKSENAKLAALYKGAANGLETGTRNQSEIAGSRESRAEGKTTCISKREPREEQGSQKGIHENVLRLESGEVQKAHTRAAGEIQRETKAGVFGEPRASGSNQSTSEGVECVESREEEGSKASPDARDKHGRFSGNAGDSEQLLRDMRVHIGEARGDVAGGGSLPCDGQDSRTVVHELQPSSREIQGQLRQHSHGSHVSSKKFIVWCHLNSEQDAIFSALKAEGISAVSIQGSTPSDKRIEWEHDWRLGNTQVLISKPSVFGWGMNWQHCHDMVFAGLDDSYESFYQAIRRCHRFGQHHIVDVHLVSAESEGAVKANLERKQLQADDMAQSMVDHMRELTKQKIKGLIMEKSEYKRDVAQGDGWTVHLGDCVEVAGEMADNSIDYSVFSPPFASLYTYSNSDRDMGNCKDYAEFYGQFKFLVSELLRITKPGRLLSFHCMNLQTSKFRDGVIGLHDFRGELTRMFTDAGWIFHSEVCIWKDPVTAMQRTKALGLLHKTIRKDSSMSRQGIPDYLVTMRKPGDNVEHISHTHETFPVDKWQRYASPVWMDINPTRTLQFKTARESDDERHICPLQLDVIERAMELWSNPGDLVFSPFTGIGSEGYVSIEMGRRFVGAELKRSYWELAKRNLSQAREVKASGLFLEEELEAA